MIRILSCFQEESRDEIQVGTHRFLINRAPIHLCIVARRRINGIDPDDGNLSEENLVGRLDKLAISSVPAGPVKRQTVNIDALLRRRRDIVLVLAKYVVMQNDRVQGPALVSTGHFLKAQAEKNDIKSRRL